MCGYSTSVSASTTTWTTTLHGSGVGRPRLRYRPALHRLNVGWRSASRTRRGHSRGVRGEAGGCPAGAVGVRVPGVHECDLCPAGHVGFGGNGELQIQGEPGIAYAAPFLITHYVTTHGYRPPQAFINAVLAVDADAWASVRWPGVPFPWGPEPRSACWSKRLGIVTRARSDEPASIPPRRNAKHRF
jgi:hypothetical protein